jgi:hypothetical protein
MSFPKVKNVWIKMYNKWREEEIIAKSQRMKKLVKKWGKFYIIFISKPDYTGFLDKWNFLFAKTTSTFGTGSDWIATCKPEWHHSEGQLGYMICWLPGQTFDD